MNKLRTLGIVGLLGMPGLAVANEVNPKVAELAKIVKATPDDIKIDSDENKTTYLKTIEKEGLTFVLVYTDKENDGESSEDTLEISGYCLDSMILFSYDKGLDAFPVETDLYSPGYRPDSFLKTNLLTGQNFGYNSMQFGMRDEDFEFTRKLANREYLDFISSLSTTSE